MLVHGRDHARGYGHGHGARDHLRDHRVVHAQLGGEDYLLEPFGLGYLRTVIFILVIAGAVQFTEMTVRKVSPPLFQMLGIYLPLITTNCAVLGVALLLVEGQMTFIESTLFAFASSIGYSLVMVIFAGLRERLALAEVPRLFAGPPIGFIVASLLALAFMGFSGISTI